MERKWIVENESQRFKLPWFMLLGAKIPLPNKWYANKENINKKYCTKFYSPI